MAIPDTAADQSVARGRRSGRSKGDMREQAILDTAWDLLATKPVDEITIDDLVAGAGITRSGFYFYFESKQAVLAAVVARYLEGVHAKISNDFDPSSIDLSHAGMCALVRVLFDDWKVNGHVYRLAFVGFDPGLFEFWEKIEAAFVRDLVAVIEYERAAGRALPSPDATDLARVINATLWRMGMLVLTRPPSPEELERRIESTAVVIERAVWGNGPRP